MDDEELLTTEDLALRYHVEPPTIRYWRHRGYGPHGTRYGRRVLYKPSDVVAWEKREQEKQDSSGPAEWRPSGAAA